MVTAPNSMKRSYPNSRSVIDTDGRKWRMCAGVAILNSAGHILVGERLKIAGAWNCPQGGVDEGETVLQAAEREAHEEVGLRTGVQICTVAEMGEEAGVRYQADGWLKKEGYAGQQLHWVLFRCVHADGDADPSTMVDLSGLGGEPAEFSAVRWAPIDEVVEGMWPAKRAPYEVLRGWARGHHEVHEAACLAVDFAGRWVRDASAGSNVTGGLLARGHTEEEAERHATAPYVQTWARADEESTGAWRVTTFKTDGITPRRELVYPQGEWTEKFDAGTAGALLREYGPRGGEMRRRTVWLAEPDAPPPRLAHVTVSQTPLGREETRRFLRADGRMVLRRAFTERAATAPAEAGRSEEVFDRIG